MNHSFIFKYSYYVSNTQPGVFWPGEEDTARRPGGQDAGRPGGQEAGRLKRHPFAFNSQLSSLIASPPPPASQLI